MMHNGKIMGIIQNDVEKNIDQFADDTALIIATKDEGLAEGEKPTDHFKQIYEWGIDKNISTID